MIIAHRGIKRVIGIGRVTRTAHYDEQKGKERVGAKGLVEDFDPNFIGVAWKQKEIDFDKSVFTFQTLSGISEEKYKKLVLGITPRIKERPKEEDSPAPELSAEERSVLRAKEIDINTFQAQLSQLGFSPVQTTNTLRLLVDMHLKKPLFFDSRTKRGTIKSALAYSVYSYLQSSSSFRKRRLNERKIAACISQSDPVNPESFHLQFHSIVSEFEEFFPRIFGGKWDREALQKIQSAVK